MAVLRELELSWGSLTETEKVGERRDYSIQQVGGHLLYKKAVGKLETCDCVHTLAPITMSKMKIKLKKTWKWMDWEIKIKIEISMSLILRDCWTSVIESSSLGFSMQEWLGEQPTNGVLYWQNMTWTHNKCGALQKIDTQPHHPQDQHIESDVD